MLDVLADTEMSHCPRLQIAKMHKKFPNAVWYNMYGPTEATVLMTDFLTSPALVGSLPVTPIGKPISNSVCYVLDEQLRAVPIGVPGELFISGTCLARGYHRRPELTEERFVPNPFKRSRDEERMYKTGDLVQWATDGNLIFLGRTDHQVSGVGLVRLGWW